MVSVAKPWLICGYRGLTIATMFFLFHLYAHMKKKYYSIL